MTKEELKKEFFEKFVTPIDSSLVTEFGGVKRDNIDIMWQWIEEKIKEEKAKIITKVKGALECEDCEGSGCYNTPHEYSPCAVCNGTGLAYQECLDDLMIDIKKMIDN